MQDAHPGVLEGYDGHMPKSCCPLRLILLISRKSEKILCLDPTLLCASFTAAVPSTVIRRCAITFNSCRTVSTSSMALATVNMNKIIKVTSASSYVLPTAWTSVFIWCRVRHILHPFTNCAFLCTQNCTKKYGLLPGTFQLGRLVRRPGGPLRQMLKEEVERRRGPRDH